jgi:mRNA interferase RelE/StbE
MARVFLTEDAKEDLRNLDGAARVLVAKALVKLEDEPEKRGAPLGAKATGDLTGLRKLVVGNRTYRIVYRVEPDGSVCVIWVIAKRADSEVYALAVSRLKGHQDAEMTTQLLQLLEVTFTDRRTPPDPL